MTRLSKDATLKGWTPPLLIPLIWLAFALRMWQLPQTPPGLWYDEAYYAMDAAWLLDGGPWRLFFAGNNGREPLFIYLQALFTWLYGATPLTARLLGPLVGTLTVPLTFVLGRRLARHTDWSPWLPYVAAAGMAISFWHIGLSRSGYRGILLPPATILTAYAFWRGWQSRSVGWFALSGVALGLSQYTYLAARVLPLVFGGFLIIWTLQHLRDTSMADIGRRWLGLLIMAALSMLIFAPLGWLFIQHPALFSARTGDVLFKPRTTMELISHVSDAVRLFIDAGDPNWRHHLPGRPMLGWLGWLGFWPGLILCMRRWRESRHLFLLTALLMLYLPALLSTPPVHALRLSSLLPFYYLIFALGLTAMARKLPGSRTSARWFLGGVLLMETILTGYDYFAGWASHPKTYIEYNGPLVDLVDELLSRQDETAWLIPFHLYVHPTTRYMLHDQFTEQTSPPQTLPKTLTLLTLVDQFRVLNVANIPSLPSLVLLTHDAQGRGVAYVSRPPRQTEQQYLDMVTAASESPPFHDRIGQPLAQLHALADSTPLRAMFTAATPERLISLSWAEQAQLVGYEVVPPVTPPGEPLTLNLYWRSLTHLTFEARLFLQLIDAQGQPIGQWEGAAFMEDMYRWRPEGLLPTQHQLWLGPETPPGPYLIRLGFFDPDSGARLPLSGLQGQPPPADAPPDQAQLGLFYVAPETAPDPRQPQIDQPAMFGETLELLGLTLPDAACQPAACPLQDALELRLHWRVQQPTEQPQTIFLQLLNEKNEVVAGWDRPPFEGLYPTTLWSPGEVVVAPFRMPLPAEGLPPGKYRLITGLYNFATGERLLRAGGGDFVQLITFETPPR